ncbi:hypothetical protein A6A40_02310 [Azospirillum humicireducens]|uniref:ASCH domain-containing protein n=2 Tax=Azospirillum humicireducens TaxID=1226968 RepID=A0A168Y0V4_9PROT|nr:hypothetical protein A6A40_02310 [Azospirillum humicireducens]
MVQTVRDIPMKGLVIREPWIDLILSGSKTWEMRSKPTLVRGQIALIRKGSGMVCGVAELVACHSALDRDGLTATGDRHGIGANQIADVLAAGWVVPWELAQVRRLPKPVPYRHPSGAVTWVNLPPEVTALIAQQSGETSNPEDTVEPARKLIPAAAPVSPPAPPVDSHIVHLTKGAIDNGYIRLTNALGLFPNDAIGGSNTATMAKGTVTVAFDPGPTVTTDVDGSKMILRDRGGTRAFFTSAGAMPGDQVLLERMAPRQIRIRMLKDSL